MKSLLWTEGLNHARLAELASRRRSQFAVRTADGMEQIDAAVTYGDASGTFFIFQNRGEIVGGYKVQEEASRNNPCGFLN